MTLELGVKLWNSMRDFGIGCEILEFGESFLNSV